MSKRLPQTKISSYFVKRNQTDPDKQPVSSIHNEESQTPSVESLEVEDSSVSISDSSNPRTVATEFNTNEVGTEALSLRDLSKKGEKPSQPFITFPQNSQGRHFSTHWYSHFSWLEYSVAQDATFCQPCRLFGGPTTEPTFSVTGLRDWRKLGEKCRKHQGSACLAAAAETHKLWMVHQKVGTVDKQLNPNDNKQHLMTILDTIIYCAKQEIPLRANDESDTSRNRGNFLKLLELIAKYDNNVTRRMKALPDNAKMLSPDIQNDLLQSLTSVLLDHIKHKAENVICYAVFADEVKDASKKELLGASLRYLHDGNIVERAIGFIELKEMSANSISSKLLELLEPFNLDPGKCVGQGYDGANVMSGKNGGVQALIKKAGYVNATYVHCASHRLNLVLSATAERHPIIKSFFDTLDLPYTFMTGTKRHAAFLDFQRERYPNAPVFELAHSCNTRWSSRSMEVERFLRRFDCILDTLSLFEDDQDAETKLAANSLLGVLQTKKFVILLVFFGRLYDYSDFCTKGFQKSTTTVSSCQILLSALIERLS